MEDHYCVTGNIPPQIPGKTTYNGQKNYCVQEQNFSDPDYGTADWEHYEDEQEVKG